MELARISRERGGRARAQGKTMEVKFAMNRQVFSIDAAATVQEAAEKMRVSNVGILPVLEGGTAVGVVSDRDLAVRCCAQGLDPRATPVRACMTAEVVSVQETQSLEEAAHVMADRQLRRLLVRDSSGQLVGVVSITDLIFSSRDDHMMVGVLERISKATSSA